MTSMPRTPADPFAASLAEGALAPSDGRVNGDVVRALRPTGVIGALEQMPLTEILQNMDFGKRSARVDVWPAGGEGCVHVHDGQIVYAEATTADGRTEGEAAVLEMCRHPGGYFHIHYAREDVARNVHRPTTFVLLEALRLIDEASASRPVAPAAVDLGVDPWGEATVALSFAPPAATRPPLPSAPPAPADAQLEDASAVIDIEVAADSPPAPQHPRFRFGAEIHVLVSDSMASWFLEDIGRGGAFLRTTEPPEKGTVVSLNLPVATGASEVAFAISARVVHVLDAPAAHSVGREPGVGVRFEDLSPAVADRLAGFVDRLAEGDGGTSSSSPQARLQGLVAESELLVAAGDLDSAQRVLAQAQGIAPEGDEVRRKLHRVNEAIDAAQANAFLERAMRGGPQAVELARRATQLRPVRDVLLRSLAVFARGGAHDEMVDVAEQLLELDPEDEGALRTVLSANVAMQRWPLALRAVESLLRLRPQDEQLQATQRDLFARAERQP